MEREIKLAQKGDNSAFEKLIRTNEASMYRVAKAILKADEDCADAIQETILKAYKSISHLKQPAYFKTWLTKILINECRKILQNRNKIVSIEEVKLGEKEADEYDDLDLKQAIKELDDELKVIVLLYYFEDLSVKEISEIINIPEGTVKSRLSRARNHLYKKLDVNEGSCDYGRANG